MSERSCANAYDAQPQEYADFADTSFSWLYIEKPAIDDALADYYEHGSDIRVLDLGCGSGRVMRHLLESGIPPENVTGIDPSANMLLLAAANLPQEVGLVKGDAAEMPFSSESFDVVVANMVLHAMDETQAEATLKRISEILVPGGTFFFTDAHPGSESLKNAWSTVVSPWNVELDVFEHDMDTILNVVAPRYGLTCVQSGQSEVSDNGLPEDPGEYLRYSTSHFRLSATLRKTGN